MLSKRVYGIYCNTYGRKILLHDKIPQDSSTFYGLKNKPTTYRFFSYSVNFAFRLVKLPMYLRLHQDSQKLLFCLDTNRIVLSRQPSQLDCSCVKNTIEPISSPDKLYKSYMSPNPKSSSISSSIIATNIRKLTKTFNSYFDSTITFIIFCR